MFTIKEKQLMAILHDNLKGKIYPSHEMNEIVGKMYAQIKDLYEPNFYERNTDFYNHPSPVTPIISDFYTQPPPLTPTKPDFYSNPLYPNFQAPSNNLPKKIGLFHEI